MKKVYLIITLTILTGISAFAQRNPRTPRTASLGFGVQVVEPKGQFADTYDGYPAGLAGTFSAPLGNTPFEAGVSVAWNSMGSQTEDVNVYVYTDENGVDIYEPADMDIRSNNNRYMILGRFRPFNGGFQPYIEGLTGFETFTTKTKISIDDSSFEDVQNSDRQHWDLALSIGWAAGLRVGLGSNFFLEARFENIQSGNVTFVDNDSIIINSDNSLEYETRESRTDKYTYQLGVAFQF
ncbi:MAG: hypothetical protein RL220_1590 [Bacteroidota bacterium]